ncbi:MAG: sigma-70 family RNA polymerase sigma factor [Pleurocapsa sp.]
MIEVLASNQASFIEGESETQVETERELILRCQHGDRDSFRLLYRRYQKRVRSTLYQLCGNAALDDLVQEVFLRAWKGLPNLQKIEYFSTWIYRISWNVATDRRRQLAKNRDFTYGIAKLSHDDYEFNPKEHPSDVQDTPDLMRLHYQDLVQRGLDSLSFDHRCVLVLHDLEDLPQKQVAKILDIPVGTVKSRLFHARSCLKKFLQQQGISF